MWPQDILVPLFGNARIATYSYESDWKDRSVKTTLRQCAEQLLNVLFQHRQHANVSRPTVDTPQSVPELTAPNRNARGCSSRSDTALGPSSSSRSTIRQSRTSRTEANPSRRSSSLSISRYLLRSASLWQVSSSSAHHSRDATQPRTGNG
jgi:hypothetical protein